MGHRSLETVGLGFQCLVLRDLPLTTQPVPQVISSGTLTGRGACGSARGRRVETTFIRDFFIWRTGVFRTTSTYQMSLESKTDAHRNQSGHSCVFVSEHRRLISNLWLQQITGNRSFFGKRRQLKWRPRFVLYGTVSFLLSGTKYCSFLITMF
jgi:hypothetical protein